MLNKENPKGPEELDDHEVLKLLVQSFKHSQGSILLQELMFSYFHRKRPDYSIPQEQIERVLPLAQKAVANLLDSNSTHAIKHAIVQGGTDGEVENRLVEMSNYFRSSQNLSNNSNHELLQEILNSLLERESYYIYKKVRPNRNPNEDLIKANWQNSTFSFLVEYGFKGQATGLDILDQMYADIKKICEDALKEQNISGKIDPIDFSSLLEVIKFYKMEKLESNIVQE